MSTGWRGTFEVQATTTRPKVRATADGEGVVSHAGLTFPPEHGHLRCGSVILV
jgi:hypothetical protein